MATGDKDGHGLETCQVLILCPQKSPKKSMMVSDDFFFFTCIFFILDRSILCMGIGNK